MGVFAPPPAEYALLGPRRVVFGFWGLPALRPEDFRALLARGSPPSGIEAIEDDAGHAPVLTTHVRDRRAASP